MKTIEQEKQESLEKYGHFNSTHEVYGVLLEEVDEFWQIVKQKNTISIVEEQRKCQSMISELIQIAAIAQRAIEELKNDQIKWV